MVGFRRALKHSAFNLRHQVKAKCARRLYVAPVSHKNRSSGVSRNALGASFVMGLTLLFSPQPLLAQPKSEVALLVSYDMGGSIGLRQKKVRLLRRQKRRVEIRGRCFSACTMYLGLPDVCVTPNAVLGFHGPKGVIARLPTDAFDHWSRVMARDLRPPLHSWFMQHARHVSSGVLRVKGSTLIDIGYQRCNPLT